MNLLRLALEAVIIGVVFAIVGILIKQFIKIDYLPTLLFVTAIVSHLILEYFGLNMWYCHYGNACKSKK